MQQDPFWLTVEDVLAFHSEQIAIHGGQTGLRDKGLLESAVNKPLNLYHYSEVRPDITDLAASYAYGIARNHPFLDGNKRAAMVACETFLMLNGFEFAAEPVEIYEIFMRLAEGVLSEEELADWVVEKTVPIDNEKQTGRKLQEDAPKRKSGRK